MKTLTVIFIVIAALSPLMPTSTVSSSPSTISFTYTEFRFYVSEGPTELSFKDMVFTVYNNGTEPLFLSCKFEKTLNVNISVTTEWNETTIQPNSQITNNYTIEVGENFNSTFIIRISIFYGNNTMLNLAGVVTNHVTYYSQNEGYELDLNIVDQSNTPRNSSVTIRHRVNESIAWTPIYEFSGVAVKIYLPKGDYQIIAIDTKTKIIGETSFTLDENKKITVLLEMVKFRRFKIENKNGMLSLNCTIDNYHESLTNIRIYAKLYYEDGSVVSYTNEDFRSIFERSKGYEIVLWFHPNFEWKNGRYTVTGYIYSSEIYIVSKSISFEVSGITEDDQPEELDALILVVFVPVIGLIVYASRKWPLSDLLKKTNESPKEGDVP